MSKVYAQYSKAIPYVADYVLVNTAEEYIDVLNQGFTACYADCFKIVSGDINAEISRSAETASKSDISRSETASKSEIQKYSVYNACNARELREAKKHGMRVLYNEECGELIKYVI